MIILIGLRHTARALSKFLKTSGQSSSTAEITCPNYLKEVTIFRGLPYALKALDVIALSYSASRRCLLCSAPFLHYVMRQYIPFRSRHVASMLHRGH